jgi:hypothetical protein
MAPDQLFSFCSTLALISWIILIFLPFWKNRDRYILGIVIILFALVYAWLIFSDFDPKIFSDFGSLDGIASLFGDKRMLLAGWIHYLAFDLLAGIYIIKNAEKNGINHWLTTPALALTFLFGPVGVLVYTVIRLAKTRNYFADF